MPPPSEQEVPPVSEPKVEPKAPTAKQVVVTESPAAVIPRSLSTTEEALPAEPEPSAVVAEAPEPPNEPVETINAPASVDSAFTEASLLSDRFPLPVAEPTQTALPSSAPPLNDADYLSPQFQNGVPTIEKPDLAAKRRWKGTVLLRGRVNTAGELDNLIIYESSGYDVLDEAALAQATGWLFEPARINQTPTAHWVQIPVVFR